MGCPCDQDALQPGCPCDRDAGFMYVVDHASTTAIVGVFVVCRYIHIKKKEAYRASTHMRTCTSVTQTQGGSYRDGMLHNVSHIRVASNRVCRYGSPELLFSAGYPVLGCVTLLFSMRLFYVVISLQNTAKSGFKLGLYADECGE